MSDTYDGAERFLGTHERIGATERRTPADQQDRSPVTREMRYESGLPLLLENGRPVAPSASLARSVQLRLKRLVLDIPLSLVALVVLAPILLFVALAVRLTSRGPALFAQQRVGLNGRTFRMLKFRTMRVEQCDPSGLTQVTADDDRLTPIGRFLRVTSIDELPQLWNILIGDMSVVGPRPMVDGMKAANIDYRDAVPYYNFRHLVKPGLSGWSQANSLRGPTTNMASARQRIDHDCAYVQNVSLLLDIKIIVRTLAREFLTGSGV